MQWRRETRQAGEFGMVLSKCNGMVGTMDDGGDDDATHAGGGGGGCDDDDEDHGNCDYTCACGGVDDEEGLQWRC